MMVQQVVERKNTGFSLMALCLGFFMVIMDATIVSVSGPAIAKELQASLSLLQWVINAYTLSFACLLLFSGNLCDRFNGKRVFYVGLSIFVVTSLLCALSTSPVALIVFRFLQGVGAAFLVPTSLALINRIYTTQKERARAIGVWGCVGGVAAASGPLLGGVLTSFFGWEAIFYVNVPIGIAALLLTKYCVHLKAEDKQPQTHWDFTGLFLSIITVGSLSFALIEAGKEGWLSANVLCGFMVFLVALIAFVLVEHRKEHPMIDVALFNIGNFRKSVIVGAIINIGLYGQLFVLPLYFHNIRGYSIFDTAMAMLPMPILVAVSSYISGRLSSRIGPKIPAIIGLFVGAVGFASLLIIHGKAPDYAYLVLPMAAIGFGVAFVMPASTMIAMSSVPSHLSGFSSGTFTMSRQAGSLLGVALFGAIVSQMDYFVGLHITFIISAALYLLGLVLMLRCKDNHSSKV